VAFIRNLWSIVTIDWLLEGVLKQRDRLLCIPTSVKMHELF